mgnify:CR=1 FL=1
MTWEYFFFVPERDNVTISSSSSSSQSRNSGYYNFILFYNYYSHDHVVYIYMDDQWYRFPVPIILPSQARRMNVQECGQDFFWINESTKTARNWKETDWSKLAISTATKMKQNLIKIESNQNLIRMKMLSPLSPLLLLNF